VRILVSTWSTIGDNLIKVNFESSLEAQVIGEVLGQTKGNLEEILKWTNLVVG